jgi:hypothetical protein
MFHLIAAQAGIWYLAPKFIWGLLKKLSLFIPRISLGTVE